MRMAGLLVVVLSLAGCSHLYVKTTDTYTPDGSKGHVLECSGQYLNWGSCEQKAGELCQERGYETLSRSDERDSTLTASPFGAVAGTNITRTMLVKCGNSKQDD